MTVNLEMETISLVQRAPDGGVPGQQHHLEDLAQIIRAYNQVTENLQRSHESLQTQVVRLQHELASADAQLQRSKRLAALGEMAAGIAHEIRNPLAAIQLYAQIVLQDLEAWVAVDDPKLATVLENSRKINSAVRRLNAVVVDVLHFAREIKPQWETLTVRSVIDQALEAHRPGLDDARITVRQHCQRHDLSVWGDGNLLHQALLNLIRNAAEAMPRGGTMTLHAQEDHQRTVLTIRDTGPGIPEEAIDRIFNPFFTTRDTGTGLGLAIVHRIIDAHGGTITVHNDHGAVFELNLPSGRPAPADPQ